jgi:predicted metal-dependent hydrolase
VKSSSHIIKVADIEVLVVRKKIKNLNLTVKPPVGGVRVSVPYHVTDETVRRVVRSRLDWIKKHQARYLSQPLPPQLEFVTDEAHYLWGKPYRLEVVERWGKHEVELTNNSQLNMFVKPQTSKANREKALDNFYRAQLEQRLPNLITKWETTIGEKVSEWRIKKMKTRWGSCNVKARRIWFNLELAKRPPEILEYILVHEMVHLLERGHNKRFYQHMDQFMPEWRSHQEVLARSPWAEMVRKI